MKGLVFIVGTGRCGTNLLRWMLNIHPQIFIANETHFIRTLVRLYGVQEISFNEFYKVAKDHYSSSGSIRWIDNHAKKGGHDLKTFPAKLKEYCSENNCKNISDYVLCFFKFCYGDKDIWFGDKTPYYGLHMNEFLQLWPNSKFIHIIRDGRFAATSMQKHMGFVRVINAGFPEKINEYSYKGVQIKFSTNPVSLRDCIQFWETIINKIRNESNKIPKENYLEVHYEDLIHNPSNVLQKINNFLQLPIKPALIKKASRIPKISNLWDEKKRIDEATYNYLTKEYYSTLSHFGYPVGSYKSVMRSIFISRCKVRLKYRLKNILKKYGPN